MLVIYERLGLDRLTLVRLKGLLLKARGHETLLINY